MAIVASIAFLLLQQPTIDELIRDLGADSVKTRDAATKALIARGADAMPALRKAAESDDPELAARARGSAGRIEIDLRTAKFRNDLGDDVLKEHPGLAERIAVADERGLIGVFAEFNGVRFSPETRTYQAAKDWKPATCATMKLVVDAAIERWLEAEKPDAPWKTFERFLYAQLAAIPAGRENALAWDRISKYLEPERIERQLNDPNVISGYAELEGPPPTAPFGHGDLLLRLADLGRIGAARALSDIGCVKARERLRPWLKSDRKETVLAAIEALAGLADVEASPAIAEHLKSDDPQILAAAIQALAWLSYEPAAAEVLKLLDHKDGNVVRAVCDYCEKVNPDGAIGELKKRVQVKEQAKREDLRCALWNLGERLTFDELKPLVESDDTYLNRYACTSLGACHDPRVTPFLRELATRKGPLAKEAMWVLADRPEPQDLPLALSFLEDEKLAESAIAFLTALDDPKARGAVIDFFDQHDPATQKGRDTRNTILNILIQFAKHPHPDYFEFLENILRSPDPQRNESGFAIKAIYKLDSDRVDDLAVELIRDSSQAVRINGFDLTSWRGKTKDLKAILEALEDPDPSIRCRAFDDLQDVDPKRAVEAAPAFFDDPNSQLNALDFMVRQKETEKAKPELVKIFESTEKSWKRERAAGLLAELGDARGANALADGMGDENGCNEMNAESLFELGDRRGAGLFITRLSQRRYFCQDWNLNMIRSRRGWDLLASKKLPDERPKFPRTSDAIAWLRDACGLKIEMDPSLPRLTRNAPYDFSYDESALEAVGGLSGDAAVLIEDDGSVRVVPFIEFHRAMLDWFNAR